MNDVNYNVNDFINDMNYNSNNSVCDEQSGKMVLLVNLTSASPQAHSSLFPYIAPERYNGNDKRSCEAPCIDV